MTPYGYCKECKQYDNLRTVPLSDGTYGYKCEYKGHVFTPSGKPAKECGE